MERDAVIEALVRLKVRRDRATMYADCYLEYREATANITKNGALVQHPRTGSPMENPYLKVRDRALAKLATMRDVPADKVPGLW